MKRYLAGDFFSNKESHYYTDDFINFYNDEDEKLTKEDLEEWAVWINSPWSQAHEKYIIKCNCKDAYTKIEEENELLWQCEYYVVGYDEITVSIYGYGNTAEESLKKCKELFTMLQDKYNPENRSI